MVTMVALRFYLRRSKRRDLTGRRKDNEIRIASKQHKCDSNPGYPGWEAGVLQYNCCANCIQYQ